MCFPLRAELAINFICFPPERKQKGWLVPLAIELDSLFSSQISDQ